MLSVSAPALLEVICGPMFSGKSEELIRRLRRAHIAKQQIITFKHSFDNRHAIEYIVSHNGTKMNARPLDNEYDIITIAQQHHAHVVGIDEAQFFSDILVTIVQTLLKSGIRVILSGLDRDFRGLPFGPMPTLLALAHSVTKLQAICTICGHEAHMTQRLVDGNPARFDDPLVLIGAQESYQARCISCYYIDIAT